MIDKLKEELKNILEINDPLKITNARGRIIRKIKKEINNTKNEEDKEELEILLEETLEEHKEQIASRYKKEFINKKARIWTIFTLLPKGIALSIRRINNSVEILKQASTNKEKKNEIMEVLKSFGVVLSTPGIFTYKYIVNNWYIVLFFLAKIGLPLLNPNKKEKDKNEDNNLEPNLQEQEELVFEEEFKELMKRAYQPNSKPVEGLNPKEWDMQYIKQGEEDMSKFKPLENESNIYSSIPERGILGLDQIHNIEPIPQPDVVSSATTEAEQYGKAIVKSEVKVNEVDRNEWDMQYIKQGEDANLYIPNEEAAQTHLNNLFEVIKYKFKTEVPGNDIYNFYNTYDDALNDYINQDMSREEAIDFLNRSDVSVKWLIGPKETSVFESKEDMLSYLNNDEFLGVSLKNTNIENYLQENQNDLLNIIGKQKEASSFSSFMKELHEMGPAAVGLFIAYEMIQYGLAFPTGGLSLALPF